MNIILLGIKLIAVAVADWSGVEIIQENAELVLWLSEGHTENYWTFPEADTFYRNSRNIHNACIY